MLEQIRDIFEGTTGIVIGLLICIIMMFFFLWLAFRIFQIPPEELNTNIGDRPLDKEESEQPTDKAR